MRQYLGGDTTALVRNPNNDMLRGFTNQHLDGRWLCVLALALFDNGLDWVSQEFAYDVLQVTQDIWKGGIQVSINVDFGNGEMRAICLSDQLLGSLPATLDDLFCVASQEYFTDSFGVVGLLGVGKVPGRIESLSEGQMLFGDDAPWDALANS
jgi:hypothetical protein